MTAPPEPSGRLPDPLAVALANASLLSLGYTMLRRRGLATGTRIVTIALVVLLVVVRSGWLQLAMAVWWPALVLHGWYLAGGWPRRTGPAPVDGRPAGPWGQRPAALAVAVPVLLAVGWLRFDASRIEREAAAAHRTGDCTRALAALDGLWFAHRVADAPLTARTDLAAAACTLLLQAERQAAEDRLAATVTFAEYATHPGALWQGAAGRRADLFLAQAAHDLDIALTGDTAALAAGFGRLAKVLKEFPGRQEKAGQVLDGFLDALPAKDACRTAAITEWLGRRSGDGGLLDRAAGLVPKLAPAALVGCGDALAKRREWRRARTQYARFLDRYPEHRLAARAKRGKRKAELGIQLAEVRRRLTTTSGGLPAYCSDPVPYRGARPYRGGGPHRALVFGPDSHAEELPAAWKAKGAADAVLVICTGRAERGALVRRCTYGSDPRTRRTVSFHKKKIRVDVYEVRTGRRVARRTIQIGGSACPLYLFYTTHGPLAAGPPPTRYVTPSAADVREAYGPLIDP